MRINHNIPAMNTHRQLSANQAATSKNIEKLSSGLRINRAGDDAAGLAISEKMRSQIRGLDMASRNSQDGISLIQTAEGALNETHSILQRMKELATQSANGTNTETDRGALQDEMNQLGSEVNRIGNATEFNAQKLLNGGRQIATNAVTSGKTLIGGSAIANTNATPATVSAGINAVAAVWDSGAITVAAPGVVNADTFTFGGVTVTLAVGAGVTGTLSSVTGTGVTLAINNTVSDHLNATLLRDNLIAAFTAAGAVGGSPIAGVTFSAQGTGIKATGTAAQGATINGLAGFAKTSANTTIATAVGSQQTTGAGIAGVTGVAASGTVTFSAAAQEGSFITLADKKIAFWNSAAATYANASEAKASLGADFVVDANPATITSAALQATAVFNAVTATGIAGYTLSNASAGVVTVTANATGAFGGATLVGKTDIAGPAKAATGSFTFDKTPAEGSFISIGGQKIGFYDSSLGNYKDDPSALAGMSTDFVVDVKGLTAEQTVDKIMAQQTVLDAKLTNKVNLGKNINANGTINLVVTAQATGFAGNTVKLDKSKDATAGFVSTFQIGANTGQTFEMAVGDMRSKALNMSGEIAGSTVTAKNGSQASFVAVANVSNGTDKYNTEFALDLSTSQKATAAISVVSDAIDTVSAQRSKLGAYQNRLEHTINNLGTASENLSAAESRIRDVDMAKEMMEQTKNNILAQAAQAMLAQANQQPQSVLQLLR